MNKRAILKSTIILVLCLIAFSICYLPDYFFYVDYHYNEKTYLGHTITNVILFFALFGIESFAESITNFFIEK